MIKEIVKDEAFLAQKSVDATPEDIQIANDLVDTLVSKKKECAGLAANMIGELKNIIAFYDRDSVCVMFNPKITKSANKFRAEESCLSLEDKHIAYRFENITVKYKDENFKTQIRTYSGFVAEVIQHEIDHCKGIIV